MEDATSCIVDDFLRGEGLSDFLNGGWDFQCWVDDFPSGEWLSGFLNGEWDFLYCLRGFPKEGRTSCLGLGLRKVAPPLLPVEVEGEDGLIQQPLVHQCIQWGPNSFHGQNGETEAQYPIEVGNSEDQAGL